MQGQAANKEQSEVLKIRLVLGLPLRLKKVLLDQKRYILVGRKGVKIKVLLR